jgi:uncharacterized Zn-binding protein involved in type VI secretion
VHFEITIESFRKTASHGSEFPVLVVDRKTGRVVMDSSRPQVAGAPLGRTGESGYAALRETTSGRGNITVDGKPAAYQVMTRSSGNANDWTIVALAPNAIGPPGRGRSCSGSWRSSRSSRAPSVCSSPNAT